MGLFNGLLQSTKCYPYDQEKRKKREQGGACTKTNPQLLSKKKKGEKKKKKKSNEISLKYTPALPKALKTFLISSFIENERRGVYSVISPTP